MGDIQGFLPIILLFAVMYLFLIRPQMKRSKQEKQFASSLAKGDKVITKSGMHGRVLELFEDGTCIIESGAGKMKYERSAISMEMSNKLKEPAVITKK